MGLTIGQVEESDDRDLLKDTVSDVPVWELERQKNARAKIIEPSENELNS